MRCSEGNGENNTSKPKRGCRGVASCQRRRTTVKRGVCARGSFLAAVLRYSSEGGQHESRKTREARECVEGSGIFWNKAPKAARCICFRIAFPFRGYLWSEGQTEEHRRRAMKTTLRAGRQEQNEGMCSRPPPQCLWACSSPSYQCKRATDTVCASPSLHQALKQCGADTTAAPSKSPEKKEAELGGEINAERKRKETKQSPARDP